MEEGQLPGQLLFVIEKILEIWEPKNNRHLHNDLQFLESLSLKSWNDVPQYMPL